MTKEKESYLRYKFIPTRKNIYFNGTHETFHATFNKRSTIQHFKNLEQLSGETGLLKAQAVFVYHKDEKNDNINSLEDIYEYGSLIEISGFDVKTDSSGEWSSIDISFVVLNKVKIIDLEDKSVNLMLLGSVKTAREIASQKEITINVLESVVNTIKNKGNFSNSVLLTNIFESFRNISYSVATPELIKEIINLLASSDSFSFLQKYDIFSFNNYVSKIKYIVKAIRALDQNNDLEEEINAILKSNLDRQQTEFILREKIKAIRKRLGEDQRYDELVEEKLNSELGQKQYPAEMQDIIRREIQKLKGMMSTSPEAGISKNYIDLAMQLPWRKVSTDRLDLEIVKKQLDNDHFGLVEIKKRIVEYLATLIHRQSNQTSSAFKVETIGDTNVDNALFVNQKRSKLKKMSSMPILTLVGPPGTGKTSIARSIADALGKEFVKISLGGVADEAELRGHRRTYVGAMPGKIVRALKKVGVSNPLILLDEIDKLSPASHRGDPAAAMLEILDPEQNRFFQDNYLEIEYDLSKVMFVATANSWDTIPEPLLDRVEIIELSSYTYLEKIDIAKNYLIPQVLAENSLDSKYFQINSKTIDYIVKRYTYEPGVRELKRVFDKIARKIIVLLLNGEITESKYEIKQDNIEKLLGITKFDPDELEKKPQVGIVNGLSYSAYGGSALQIEVITSPGQGDIKLTGQLKDVMQESARIALSYVQANSKKFGIDFDFSANQFHIHVPEGAVPKDGPSAGVTFTTAIISALLKKAVPYDIAMTGEITLHGKVLQIGGLKEKSLGAFKNGIKTVFIPKSNEKHLPDIPKEVHKTIKFIPVTSYEQIYKNIFK